MRYDCIEVIDLALDFSELAGVYKTLHCGEECQCQFKLFAKVTKVMGSGSLIDKRWRGVRCAILKWRNCQ